MPSSAWAASDEATSGDFAPIAFTDEYTYCCGSEACYLDRAAYCGYCCCPLCCCAHPDPTLEATMHYTKDGGFFGPEKMLLSYKFEKMEFNGRKGFRATEIFRNAKAVDAYHHHIMGNTILCSAISLMFRQNFGEMKVYGNPAECAKVTYDAGRVETDMKKKKLVEWKAESVQDVVDKFGALHYGWSHNASLSDTYK